MLKKLFIFILICAVLVTTGLFCASYFLKPMLEKKLLEAARAGLGEGLEVSEVGLNLAKGTVLLKGVRIDDCRYVSYRNSAAAKEIFVDIDVLATLLQKAIVLQKVSVKNFVFDLDNIKNPEKRKFSLSGESKKVLPIKAGGSSTSTEEPDAAIRRDGLSDKLGSVKVERFTIEDSTFRFLDHSTKPSPNVIEISDVNGNVDMLSYSSGAGGLLEGTVSLQAALDPSGDSAIKADGSFTSSKHGIDFDLHLYLEDVSLTIFEPYYSKTSLAILKEAKVDIESQARCRNNNLNAHQSARIYDIELYDIKPGSEDSLFGLPAKTVIDFFEDSKGDVGFDFNIVGTISDPKFEVGPVIQQVLTKALRDKIMTKLQDIPFEMLKMGERSIGENLLHGGGVTMPDNREIRDALDKVETKIKNIIKFK